MQIKKLGSWLCIGLLPALILVSCTGNNKSELEQEAEKIDSNKSNIDSVGGTMLSIPSPIQTSMLLKKSGAPYSKAILNVPANVSKYSTAVKKALNLGIYGADLGYVILYQQTQDAIGYLSTVKKLGDELGVSGAFSESLLKRFEKNMDKQDSLMSLSSEAFRSSDAYLKNNERLDASALIIAGGWIEGLYFTTQMVNGKVKDKTPLIQRIGEQKNTLDNLIKLLTPYYQQEGYTEFIDALIDLASTEFDKVEVKYNYIKPTTDEVNKITTINSTTETVVTPEILKNISEKIAIIRNSLVQ